MAIKLVQLKSFCALMQDPDYSVTKTAERIHIDHTALSRQISALEEDLGIRLFDRKEHRKLKPTKEAHLFYKKAVGYMNGIDGLIKDFKEELKEFNNAHLNIALHKTIATFIFPPILERMLKLEEFKDLKVNIHNISKEEAIKKLIGKEIDLAFYIHDSRDETPIEIETIQSIQNCACLVFNRLHPLAQKSTITKEDVEKYCFLNEKKETKVYNTTYSYFNTKNSNIKISGTYTSEVALEILKFTDNVEIFSKLFLDSNKYIDKSNLEVRSIEHLIDEKAFFQIMILKNYYLTKPVLWIINELKKLK